MLVYQQINLFLQVELLTAVDYLLMMTTRYINQIFTAVPESVWSNQDAMPYFNEAIEALSLPDAELESLLESVQYFMMGKRTRHTIPDWLTLNHFAERASEFEKNTDLLLDKLASQILLATADSQVSFDALITTTSTGNLMPGISYRLAKRLENRVKPETMMLDLGNVGCTGGIKALNCASHLDDSFHNILVVSVELPSTLVNLKTSRVDVWQGNSTFGDGSSALWVSDRADVTEQALKIEKIHTIQQAKKGFDLIKWGYGDYYSFNVEDESTFEQSVRTYLTKALQETAESWKDNPHWAIHPAGILLLMRLSRKLGIPRTSMRPTTSHYEQYSNMSSSGILHIIQSQQDKLVKDEVINLITMGAGFNVIYGCLRKVSQ